MLTSSGERRFLPLALLLIAGILALYHQVHTFQFIEDYDDGAYVTNNFHIKYGIDSEAIHWAFTAYYAQNWHPLTWISHALDCQLYYLNSGRHHETNVVLHAVNALLLFWVLWKATGFAGRSLMVAALFALHPVNVESVAWIAERKNVLSTFFFLLALGSYGWYAAKPGVKRYLLVLLLFAAALMGKPQVITFPCIALLWDYWPLGRLFSAQQGAREGVAADRIAPAKTLVFLVLEKIPLFLLAAASALVTLLAQGTGDAMRGAMKAHTLIFRLENAAVSYARYLTKAIWPVRLSPFYTFPPAGWETWRIMVSVALLIAITVLVFRARNQARYLLVGWLWFIGSLVPMIGVVQVGSQAMADRYAYIAFVGLFIMICWGGAGLCLRVLKAQGGGPAGVTQTPVHLNEGGSHLASLWLTLVSLAVLVVLAMTCHRQIGYWKNSLTLWSHAVEVDEHNDVAQDKLGSLLVVSGHEDEAMFHFRAAIQANPLDPQLNFHMGFSEQRRGDLPAALDYYKKVLSLTQDDVLLYAGLRNDALTNMSVAYRDLGDFTKAAECFDEAARLRRQYQK